MIVEEKGLKITEDAILLSEFMKKYFSRKRKNLKGEKSFLEIGAGQGIISLLLSELDITRFFLCEDDKLDFYFQTIIGKENIFWELFLCLFV